MAFLQQRIKDSSLLRLIGKWLHAGVLEDGRLLPVTKGTSQGAVISPILANVYLHYVLDEWMETVVKPRMRGQVSLIRYADDRAARTPREPKALEGGAAQEMGVGPPEPLCRERFQTTASCAG